MTTRRTHSPRAGLLLSTLAALAIAACGGSDPGGSTGGNDTNDTGERNDTSGADSGDNDATAEDTVSDATDDAAEDVAEDIVEDVAEDTADDAVEDVAEEVVEDIVEEVAEDAAEDSPADVAEDVAQDTAVDTATDLVEDSGTPPVEVVRLIVMGDTGEANADQYAVAAAAQTRCNELGGCDGFLMLGDNIYDDGPEENEDSEFTEKIDLPYADLRRGAPPEAGQPDERERMPIYVSLGNHDLGSLGVDSSKVSYYVDYGSDRDWFYFPSESYELQLEFVHLIALNTSPMAYLDQTSNAQAELIANVVDNTDAIWTVSFGHHPYRSNGTHGNAGSYEGIPSGGLPIPFLGAGFQDFVEDHICDRVDFYVCGHDHNRQWITGIEEGGFGFGGGEELCDTQFVVSGAGAKTKDLEGRGNEVAWENEDIEGFMIMSFYRDRVEAEFTNKDGVREFSTTVQR